MRINLIALTLCIAACSTPAVAAQGEVCQSEALAATMTQPIG